MGGEIKVIKKNGQGTLMQLFMILSTPEDNTEQYQVDFAKHGMVVSRIPSAWLSVIRYFRS